MSIPRAVILITLTSLVANIEGDQNRDSSSYVTDECGSLLRPKINIAIEGNEAPLGYWPWMALIGTIEDEPFSTAKFLCNGILVTDLHVLTPAHCTLPFPRQRLLVRLNEHDTSTYFDCDDFECHKSKDILVNTVITHPGYQRNHPSRRHNLAVIRLPSGQRYHTWLCLPIPQVLGGEKFSPDMWPYSAGWAVDNETQTALHHDRIKLAPSKDCGIKYGDMGTLCGSPAYSDGLLNEGNPLMFPNKYGSRWFLIGLLSFTTPNHTAVYTYIPYYTGWLQSVVPSYRDGKKHRRSK